MNDRQERFMNFLDKILPKGDLFMWVSKHGLLDFVSLIHIQDESSYYVWYRFIERITNSNPIG